MLLRFPISAQRNVLRVVSRNTYPSQTLPLCPPQKRELSKTARTAFGRSQGLLSDSVPPESSMAAEDPFKRALENNKKWSSDVQAQRPDYLPELAKSQAPKILWIGCSDSRVPAETITGLSPGELFVHRNIANVLNPTDLSSLSVIEYACNALKVQHIVVCGHQNCGGVGAALGNKKIGKIDTWLSPLRRLRMANIKELDAIKEPSDKIKKLVELNVRDGVETLRENPDVVEAQRDRGLQIHGVVYNLATGQLIDLDIPDDLADARKAAFDLA